MYPRSSLLDDHSSLLVPRCINKRLGTVLKMASPKQLLIQARSEETTNKRLETHPVFLSVLRFLCVFADWCIRR